MEQDLISVIDIANQLGKRKQSIFKIIKRLGIETKMRSTHDSRGQSVAHITLEEFSLIRDEIDLPLLNSEDGSPVEVISGLFYLIQLEPEHDPGRFKVGFTSNLSERLRSHRCAAPFSQIIKTWACRSLWEKTAIECISATCERIHTEVFRASDINLVVAKCDQFFDLMPKL